MAARAGSPSLAFLGALSGAAALGVVAGVDPRIAAAAAVGLLFIAIVLNDVSLGLCLLVFVAFLDALPTFGSFSAAKFVGLLLAVSWAATVATRREKSTLFGTRPLFGAVTLLFLAWAALSIAWAESKGAGLTAMTRYAPNLLLFPIVYVAVRSTDHVTRVLAVIVGAAAFAAAVGIVSPPPDPDAAGDVARATGTVGDANELAASLVVGLVIAGSFVVNRGYEGLVRLIAAGAAGICLIGILLTVSRGGILALGAALIAAIVFSGRWRLRAVGFAVATSTTALFYFTFLASSAVRDRLLSNAQSVSGGTGRIDLWTVAERMVRAHPLEGVGAGNFQASSIHYLLQPGLIQRDDFIISASPKVAHNTYLQILAETGVVGETLFLAILAFALATIVFAARSFARQGDERMELLARGLLVALVGYLTAIIFLSLMYSKLLWLLLALGPPLHAIALARERRAERAAAELTAEPVGHEPTGGPGRAPAAA